MLTDLALFHTLTCRSIYRTWPFHLTTHPHAGTNGSRSEPRSSDEPPNAPLGSAPNPRSLVGNKPTEVRVDILPWPLKVSIVRAALINPDKIHGLFFFVLFPSAVGMGGRGDGGFAH